MRVEVEAEQAADVQASTKKLDYCTRQLDCIYKHRWIRSDQLQCEMADTRQPTDRMQPMRQTVAE